jgi:hypothetical protein
MFGQALKAIIDLLRLRKDVKKTDLEILKLEKEQKKAESSIQLASFEDIVKYDPGTRKRINLAHDDECRKRACAEGTPRGYRNNTILAWLLILILFLVLLYALYKYFG